jgi:uncharacterized protein (TIGR00730 family)
MRRICVFCGSSPGAKPAYAQAMAELGRSIAQRGLELVYGGGNVGLMGTVADAALGAGGTVIGVIPGTLVSAELAHPGLSALHVVETMHDRKAMMADLSDAFIAAPGGIGTLEEAFEIWSWGQLGLHAKPLGFFDVDGYYDGLHAFLDLANTQGFVRDRHRAMTTTEQDPTRLLDWLADYEAPTSLIAKK